jgi:hypothetical protein
VIGDHPVVGEGLRAPRSDRGPRLDRPGAARLPPAEPARMREPAAASPKSRTGRRTHARLLPSAQPPPADDGETGRTPLARPSVTLPGTSSGSQVKTAASTKAHVSGGRPKLVLAAPVDDKQRCGRTLASRGIRQRQRARKCPSRGFRETRSRSVRSGGCACDMRDRVEEPREVGGPLKHREMTGSDLDGLGG